jgi:hypothetical protein
MRPLQALHIHSIVGSAAILLTITIKRLITNDLFLATSGYAQMKQR